MPQKQSKNTNAALFDKAWAAFIDKNAEQEPPVGAVSAEDFARMSKGRCSVDAAKCLLMRRARSGELLELKVNRRCGRALRPVRYYLPVLK